LSEKVGVALPYMTLNKTKSESAFEKLVLHPRLCQSVITLLDRVMAAPI
jgi:hypothetical protein